MGLRKATPEKAQIQTEDLRAQLDRRRLEKSPGFIIVAAHDKEC
jgi:hypothetical protein